MHAFCRRIHIGVWLLVAGLLSGCLVTSLRPLSDGTHPPVFDNSLLGRWENMTRGNDGDRENKTISWIRFEAADAGKGSSYKITYATDIDNQVRTGTLYGNLVQIGSLKILETASPPEQYDELFQESNYGAWHLLPVVIFSKVAVTDNSLAFSPLNAEWFERAVLLEGVSLPCVFHCGGGRIWGCYVLLTGTPGQLREVIRKYGEQPGFFKELGEREGRFYRKN